MPGTVWSDTGRFTSCADLGEERCGACRPGTHLEQALAVHEEHTPPCPAGLQRLLASSALCRFVLASGPSAVWVQVELSADPSLEVQAALAHNPVLALSDALAARFCARCFPEEVGAWARAAGAVPDAMIALADSFDGPVAALFEAATALGLCGVGPDPLATGHSRPSPGGRRPAQVRRAANARSASWPSSPPRCDREV